MIGNRAAQEEVLPPCIKQCGAERWTSVLLVMFIRILGTGFIDVCAGG